MCLKQSETCPSIYPHTRCIEEARSPVWKNKRSQTISVVPLRAQEPQATNSVVRINSTLSILSCCDYSSQCCSNLCHLSFQIGGLEKLSWKMQRGSPEVVMRLVLAMVARAKSAPKTLGPSLMPRMSAQMLVQMQAFVKSVVGLRLCLQMVFHAFGHLHVRVVRWVVRLYLFLEDTASIGIINLK